MSRRGKELRHDAAGKLRIDYAVQITYKERSKMDVLQISSWSILSSNSSSVILPIMQGFASLFILGSAAFQSVFGLPGVSDQVRRDPHILKRAVDDFLTTEEPIALEQLLCNIGSGGCHSSGVANGLVIASPSTDSPDCKKCISSLAHLSS